MIKFNHVTGIVLATVLVLGVAVSIAYHQVVQAQDSYVAEVSMHETLASVRQLQIVTRALQSERADYQAIRRDWEEVRRDFPRQLHDLEQALITTLPDRPQLKRIHEIWRRMEAAHGQIGSTLIHMKENGLLTQIGTSSLIGVYQEMLGQRSTPDVLLGEIGLLLFQLEHTDRMVQEVEFELRELSRNLAVRTNDTVRNSRTAAATVLGIATILVVGLLVRIALLYSSLASDINARRAAEQAAQASANDLYITLNSIADAVIATDNTGRVVRLNPAATRLLALTPQETMGRPVRELFNLISADHQQGAPNPVDSVILSGQVAEIPSNTRLVRHDKVELQISAIATPIRDDHQVMSGVVLVVRDVTEQTRLAEQLRRTQKIESMGQLAGGVAHDFNNLLQVVKVNANFLAEDPYLTAESRQFLSDIGLAVNRAADLTRQLLALGRRQTLQIKELDPAELTRSILKLVHRVLGEHIEIVFNAASELESVRGDPGQLEQVILNLCVNARDAMPGGGRLTLSLDNVVMRKEQVRAWPWARAGRYVRLLVTDTGSGMSPEQLTRIFEPFYTTKPTGQGTGLGLSVVQGIVQQHEGFISVYSEVGLGTTFHLYLPSHAPTQHYPVVDPTPGLSAPLPAGTETILLVEDDPAVRQVTMALLKRQGYQVLVAGDGEEACAIVAAKMHEISLVILDVVMPRMGGIEAGRKIQAMRPALPIILCTGYAGGMDVPELRTGWGLLHKPYANEALLRAIPQVLTSAKRK